MKKKYWIAVILFLGLFLFGFTGCSSPITSPKFTFGTDAWRGYYTHETYMMTESEDSYYYVSQDGYIHVIDKKSMVDIVLCGRPDCPHDKNVYTVGEKMDLCNGYVFPHYKQSIFFYQDHLYTVSWMITDIGGIEPTLMQISLDGSEQKEIWKFEYQTPNETEIPYSYIFHRGVLYFAANARNIGESCYLFAYDTKEKECTLLYESDKKLQELRMVGNSIYFRQDKPYASDLICYDIAKKSLTTVIDGADVLDIGNEKFIYRCSANNEAKEFRQWFATSNYDGTKETEYEMDVSAVYHWLQTDGTYLFLTESAGYGNKSVNVYDYASHELINSIPVPEKMQEEFYLMCTLDGKLILYNRMGSDKAAFQFYFGNISDISTDKFKWEFVEKIN